MPPNTILSMCDQEQTESTTDAHPVEPDAAAQAVFFFICFCLCFVCHFVCHVWCRGVVVLRDCLANACCPESYFVCGESPQANQRDDTIDALPTVSLFFFFFGAFSTHTHTPSFSLSLSLCVYVSISLSLSLFFFFVQLSSFLLQVPGLQGGSVGEWSAGDRLRGVRRRLTECHCQTSAAQLQDRTNQQHESHVRQAVKSTPPIYYCFFFIFLSAEEFGFWFVVWLDFAIPVSLSQRNKKKKREGTKKKKETPPHMCCVNDKKNNKNGSLLFLFLFAASRLLN